MERVSVRWGAVALAAAAILAARAARAEETRVAFVDIRKAVLASDEGKAAERRFAKLAEEKREKLRPLEEELKRLEEEFEKQKYVLSEEALAERQLELIQRRRELQRRLDEAEEELRIENLRLLQPLRKKVLDAAAAVAKERGFAMVLDRNAPGLVYFDESLDVTDLVIDRMNRAKD